MPLDMRRRIRNDLPEANISNKTLPGFAVMGVGLLIMVVGAILIAALGSPKSDTDFSKEPKKLAGVTVVAIGGVVLIVGIVISIWLKTRKPEPQYDDSHHHDDDQQQQQQQQQQQYDQHYHHQQHQPHVQEYSSSDNSAYGRPSTVSNGAYHMNYPMYGGHGTQDPSVPTYGPPAPYRKS